MFPERKKIFHPWEVLRILESEGVEVNHEFCSSVLITGLHMFF
jgi:hypothetical protein